MGHSRVLAKQLRLGVARAAMSPGEEAGVGCAASMVVVVEDTASVVFHAAAVVASTIERGWMLHEGVRGLAKRPTRVCAPARDLGLVAVGVVGGRLHDGAAQHILVRVTVNLRYGVEARVAGEEVEFCERHVVRVTAAPRVVTPISPSVEPPIVPAL